MREAWLLLALPLLVVACGGTRATSSPLGIKHVHDALLRTAAARTAHLTISSSVGTLNADVETARHRLRVRYGGATQLIVIGSAEYTHLKHRWVKAGIDPTRSVGGGVGAWLITRPADLIRKLAVVTRVRDLGVETVKGVRMRHFSAWIQLPAVLKSAKIPNPLDVWTAGGYVRRLQLSTFPTVTIDLSRFGEHLNIQPPRVGATH